MSQAKQLSPQVKVLCKTFIAKTTSWEELDGEEEVNSISMSVGEVDSNTLELRSPRLASRPFLASWPKGVSTVYLGCHGQTVARDPSDSGILLAGGADKQPRKLTVQDLATSRPRDHVAARRHAGLSVCLLDSRESVQRSPGRGHQSDEHNADHRVPARGRHDVEGGG